MNSCLMEAIYDSLQGVLEEPIAGVENLFAPGKPCAVYYKMYMPLTSGCVIGSVKLTKIRMQRS